VARTEAHAARRLRGWATRAALAALCAGLSTGAGADELKPFTASYTWTWHGMNVAVTTVRLEQHGDTWQYSSQSAARGIGRMLSLAPKTVSVLKIAGADVQPLSYQGDDGSSSSKRTVNVTYDWEHQRVTGVYEDTPVALALTPGVQDDSSIQIALMAALLHGRTPDHFTVLDKNAVRAYQYRREGEATLHTPLGDVATVIYSSARANSPRVNRYWCAPSRGFIPLRVQQKRGEEVEWTMDIESLTRD
jgi:Protein of unknown function (DUF3108)